jgi:hypothetical protein
MACPCCCVPPTGCTCAVSDRFTQLVFTISGISSVNPFDAFYNEICSCANGTFVVDLIDELTVLPVCEHLEGVTTAFALRGIKCEFQPASFSQSQIGHYGQLSQFIVRNVTPSVLLFTLDFAAHSVGPLRCKPCEDVVQLLEASQTRANVIASVGQIAPCKTLDAVLTTTYQ